MQKVCSLFLFVALLVLGEASYATYFTAKVVGVRATGETGESIIVIRPGNLETKFSEQSRVKILPSDPGANAMLAAVLTAVSLGFEIYFDVESTPSFGNIQAVNYLGASVPLSNYE